MDQRELRSEEQDTGLAWPGSARPADAVGPATAEEAARKYGLLSDYARDVILFVRYSDGRLLEANRAALQAYGYEREELLSLTIHDLRAPETAHLTLLQMQEAQANGILFETRHRRKDGSTFPVEVSSAGTVVEGEPALLSIIRDISRQERAEDALRESEARIRGILGGLSDGVAVVGLDGRFVEVNEAAYLPYCDDPAELIGTDVYELVVPEDRERAIAEAAVVLEKGFIRSEVRTRGKDGTVYEVEIDVSPLRDADGQPLAFLGVVRDVGERKRMEAALRESEELHRTLVETATDVIYTLTADGTIAWLNPAFERLTGWPTDEWIGRSQADLLHPDDVSLSQQMSLTVLSGQTSPAVEVRVRTMSGEYVNGELTVAPLFQDGVAVGAVGIGRDITNRKRAEEEHKQLESERERFLAHMREANEALSASNERLRESREALREAERRYRLLADSTADLVLWLGPDGRPLYVSPSCERLTGYPRDDLASGKVDLRSLVHRDDRGRVARLLREGIRGSAGNDVEWRLKGKDGRFRWVSASWQPLQGEDGELLDSRWSLRDISERKQLESERERFLAHLREANEVLSTLNDRLREQTEKAERQAGEMDAVFAAIADGVLVYDAAGTVVRVNKAVPVALGFDPTGIRREMAARRCGIRRPGDEEGTPLRELPVGRALRGEAVVGERLVVRDAEGRDRAIMMSASPLRAGGKVVGVVAV
ncbi:MAG: PAS domain S-box protein, partial [Chloroflexota bacterium]